jgi:DNA modification methylase
MKVKVIVGDCREKLKCIPDNFVNCIVTSPPYYGLRDYGVDGQIGLEQTPDDYISEMVAVFREAKRVLRDDGTFWLNIGDSYANGGGKSRPHRDSSGGIGCKGTRGVQGYHAAGGGFNRPSSLSVAKPKDLLMIPARVALALQADGWYLRSEIVWAKPNPMPESVRDRPTSAHEKVYMFAKSGKTTIWKSRDTLEWSNMPDLSETVLDDFDQPMPRWQGHSYFYDADAVKEPGSNRSPGNHRHKYINGDPKNRNKAAGLLKISNNIYKTRNMRNVWTIGNKPFKGAHFAVFPPALVEPCIKAGCPKGGIVLDPFGGSGTVGLVARSLGRHAILIELNQDYAQMARERLERALTGGTRDEASQET